MAGPARAGDLGAGPLTARGRVAALFVLSGAAALVYQVVWQRLLMLHTGVGIVSVALIVAAFLAGLGLGSHLGALWTTRLPPTAALRAFAALEIGVALYAAASPYLFYDLLYRRWIALYASLWWAGPLHVAALLAPTTAMGMSLPLLARALVSDAPTAPRTIGALYGLNTLGAALGALATPWLLVPALGLRGAVYAGAACNVAAGLGALVVASPESGAACVAADPGVVEPRRPFALWTALYALSGFVAIGLEIVWFRLVEVAAKATSFAFGTVLALYLFGLGLGGLAGAGRVHRVRRPLAAFVALQAAILAWSGAGVMLLAWVPPEAPLYSRLLAYWARPLGYRPALAADAPGLLVVYGLLPGLLFLLPTFLMGVSFCVLQRAVQDDPETSARKLGFLQAANILGCVAGSLAVGLGALRWLGSTGTLRALLLLGAGLAVFGARATGRRALGLLAAGLLALALALPGQQTLWSRLHGRAGGGTLVAEDATGVAALTPLGSGAWRLYNNGWSHSSLPFGAHTLLGLAPVVAHPAPRDVAIIGLGSGDTAWGAGLREATEHIVVFEIRAGQEPLLRRLAAREDLPQLARLLADPRLEVRIEDGRRALQQERRLYDVIETDPQYPDAAGAGMLYSLEFYELCRTRLKPGGVMCAWAPTGRVTDTFRRVFRNTLVLPDAAILLGSDAALTVDAAAWRARLATDAARTYLAPFDPERAARQLLAAQSLGRGLKHPELLREPNRDLEPRDEFERRAFRRWPPR